MGTYLAWFGHLNIGAPIMADLNNTTKGKALHVARTLGQSSSPEARVKATREVSAMSPRIVATIGNENTNIRIAILQLQDGLGNSIAAVADYQAWLVEDADGIQAVVGAASIKDGGVGTEVYGEGTPNFAGKTDDTGKADLDITDEAGASGKTFWLHIRVLNVNGTETRQSTVFD